MVDDEGYVTGGPFTFSGWRDEHDEAFQQKDKFGDTILKYTAIKTRL